ncbi:MAG TPA: GtrA family protein [Thermomicrobiales bacterium]|nr:GtrA family protein [Thermomicrobiales bacterium]
MISTRTWPAPAVRAFSMVQRLQKFLLVGALGLLTQQVFVFLFHDIANWSNRPSLVAAIGISMAVTFVLNEMWTWHDRGSGSILQRMLFYVPINTIGLLINLEVAVLLNENAGVHLQIASLIGAGVAAVWNFTVNNFVTWRT